MRRPKLNAFVATIDGWLDEDLRVPRKQGHTAKRVFDRLSDECGFTGGYTIIKDYMRAGSASPGGVCSAVASAWKQAMHIRTNISDWLRSTAFSLLPTVARMASA